MVETQIRARGIVDPRLLEVMTTVPRERFVRVDEQEDAFSDRALPIDYGQTISQPFIVAAMTDRLKTLPHHRVLEIGTGSGYQTAILARLVSHVYTVERLAPLAEQAHTLLDALGIQNISYHIGDGSLGWQAHAPFDRIMVTAGSPEVPHTLVDQLTDGGRMVIPVGQPDRQTLVVVEKQGTRTREIPQFACRFVKLVGSEAWHEPIS